MTALQHIEEKMPPALPAGRRLVSQLREQQACPEPCRREEAERLDAVIAKNLAELGYGA